jgi:hypothetical protein
MARHIDDFELDPAIVLIADDVDTSPAAVSEWFESLKRLEPVNTTISAAQLVREIREYDER